MIYGDRMNKEHYNEFILGFRYLAITSFLGNMVLSSETSMNNSIDPYLKTFYSTVGNLSVEGAYIFILSMDEVINLQKYSCKDENFMIFLESIEKELLFSKSIVVSSVPNIEELNSMFKEVSNKFPYAREKEKSDIEKIFKQVNWDV
jgi:hypothetical protein